MYRALYRIASCSSLSSSLRCSPARQSCFTGPDTRVSQSGLMNLLQADLVPMCTACRQGGKSAATGLPVLSRRSLALSAALTALTAPARADTPYTQSRSIPYGPSADGCFICTVASARPSFFAPQLRTCKHSVVLALSDTLFNGTRSVTSCCCRLCIEGCLCCCYYRTVVLSQGVQSGAQAHPAVLGRLQPQLHIDSQSERCAPPAAHLMWYVSAA